MWFLLEILEKKYNKSPPWAEGYVVDSDECLLSVVKNIISKCKTYLKQTEENKITDTVSRKKAKCS